MMKMRSYWQIHSKGPEHRCDVAVIGGGIVGCSAAYWLAKTRPECRITIVERGSLASGASGRNAGFLLQGVGSDYLLDCRRYGPERAKRLYRFTRENRDLILSEVGSAAQIESSGSLVVAGSEEEDHRLREAVGLMRSDGAPAMYFSREETNRRISGRGFLGSLYAPSGAMFNPVSLVQAIATRSGANLLENHLVEHVESSQDGVLIETPVRLIRANRVIVAVNAWLPTLFPSLNRFVRPVRAQMLATTAFPQRWLDVPVYSHDGFYYVRQSRSGVLLAGGARHRHEAVEVGYDGVVTNPVQNDIEEYLRRHFPKAEGLQVDSRWSGVMGFSPDGLPVYGMLPGIEGSVWASGFTGHGMAYGFRFGKLLAEVASGQADSDSADLFGMNRFDASAGGAAAAS